MRSTKHRMVGIIALVTSLALIGAAGVTAQGTGNTQTQLDLSAAIHQGTCDAPGVTAAFQVGDFIPIQEAEIVGSSDIALTMRAQQTLQTDFDDLFGPNAPDYAFVVLDNTDPEAEPVACGALGGVQVNGQLVVGLTATDAALDDDALVGVAVFGSTEPTGPTTQPAQTPGQMPVQAYVSEDALTPAEPTPMTVPSTQTPPPASPTSAPSTPIPTQPPTTAPTEAPTTAPTEEPTMAPTEVPTELPTMAPTEAPTELPTQMPTEAPPPTSEATVT